MKRNIINTIYALLIPVLLVCCSPDSINHPDKSGLPKASDIKATVSVDQSTNTVTFGISNKACMPMWIFEDGKKSTVNGLEKVFPVAGDYTVEIKLINANGISDGSIIQEFTIDNTIIDFEPYYRRLAGTEDGKLWVWASDQKGHFGCGPLYSDGLEWYSANPGDKTDFGLYDDTYTFVNDNFRYIYNPGEGGTTFVNVGCSIFPEFNTTGEDFMVPTSVQEKEWEIEIKGNDLFLKFPAGTFVGYVPCDGAYNNPVFRIISLKENSLELAYDNEADNITWHYSLVPAKKEVTKADMLAGASGKTWLWDQNNKGHFGCGPAGSDGLEWYSANPGDKADFGLYCQSFTFYLDGNYSFEPGDDGTVYVNKGCSLFPEYDRTEDFVARVDPQNSSWSFEEVGSELYLVFPPQTMVGYIPSDEFFENPRFRVLDISETSIDLIVDLSDIAWHYRFVTDAGDAPEVFEEGEELMLSEYASNLAGTWTWEPMTSGHLGCGETPATPTGWWSAAPFEKDDLGLYDDIMTFGNDGSFTFNPGEGGTVYVNMGVTTVFQEYKNGEEDFQAPSEIRTSSFTTEIVDNVMYIQFAPNTIVSYITADEFYSNPRVKVIRMCDNVIELATIQSDISWKFRWKKID